MKLNVLFSPASTSPGFELIQALLDDDIKLTFSENIPTEAAYHLLVSATPTRDHLSASPNLRTLIVPSTGPSPNIVRLVSDFPHVSLHQLPYNSAAVAETALALLLAAAKFIMPADAAMRRDDWSLRYSSQPQLMLSERKDLILGYGRVGKRIAKILRAFDVEVSAIRCHPERSRGGKTEANGSDANSADAAVQIHGEDALPKLLPNTDFVICALPNTPETENWIGTKEIGLMGKDTIVVNVGHAKVFDEAALFVALRGKHIGGAGLDVWYNNPAEEDDQRIKQPSRYPFAALDNVVMSPHRAGQLGQLDGGRAELLASMIQKAKKGELLPYQVNLELGY